MTELSFVVFGVAQPKGSTRAFMRPGMNYPVVISDNPKNKNWQQLVAEAASRELTGGGLLLEGPVILTALFFLPRPKSLPKKTQTHLKKPDLDKLIRSVKDALTSVVWRDDAQVVRIIAEKTYAGETESPRAFIKVRTLSGV